MLFDDSLEREELIAHAAWALMILHVKHCFAFYAEESLPCQDGDEEIIEWDFLFSFLAEEESFDGRVNPLHETLS